MSEARRVLVTGATGGLGIALVEALVASGYRVRASGRDRVIGNRLTALGAEFLAADLTDPGAADALCRDQQSVFHAAALSSPWGAAADFDRINVSATAALIEAAKRSGVRRFVHVSSPSIYAAFRDRLDLTEQSPPALPALNHYARTKAAGETLVREASGDLFQTAAIRPRAIVGPDDRVILPRLMAMAARGRMPLIRGGNALIELTDVRDVAHALILAERHIDRVAGGAVNISGGVAIPVKKLAQQLADAMGTPLRLIPIPLPAARLMAVASEALAHLHLTAGEPVLTRYTLATMSYSQIFDLGFARQILGFVPRHDAVSTLINVARERMK